MSMISAQIDELRKWADQLSERENEFGVVVRALVAALREAADTILRFRDDLQRANDENAKLRELVLEIWRSCPVSEDDCAKCQHRIEESDENWCDIPILMEKLGIEVD